MAIATYHHHPKWIHNIPYGQFCRLRRTCTRKSDYEKQGSILKRKLLEKGYKEDLVEQAYSKYWIQYDESHLDNMEIDANTI